MQRVSVNILEGLEKDLDIFSGSKSLSREILQSGLYPPLPISGKVLIWGFHILRTANQFSEKELICTRIPQLSPQEMLGLALKLEDRAGSYSWFEKQNILMFLSKSGISLSSGDFFELIQGRNDPHLAEKITHFSQLSSILKNLVAEHLLDLKTALEVQTLPEPVFIYLKENKKRLSFSQRRLFLTRLFEIARKKNMSPESLLSLIERAFISNDPLGMLTRLRYPELSKLENQFDELKGSTVKGTGIKLMAPSFFEGNSFTVGFTFNSKNNLSRKIQVLEQLKEKTVEFFALLH